MKTNLRYVLDFNADIFNVNNVKKYSQFSKVPNSGRKCTRILTNWCIKTELIINKFNIPVDLINIIKEYLYMSVYEYNTICLYNYVGLRNKNKELHRELLTVAPNPYNMSIRKRIESERRYQRILLFLKK
jgi:hypothetical protein